MQMDFTQILPVQPYGPKKVSGNRKNQRLKNKGLASWFSWDRKEILFIPQKDLQFLL
jgi:hypothetical protein